LGGGAHNIDRPSARPTLERVIPPALAQSAPFAPGYFTMAATVRSGNVNRRVNERTSVAGAVAQFALSGFLAVVVIAIAATFVLRHVARDEAVREARDVTEVAGRGIVQPAVDSVAAADPAALRRLDRVVRARVLRGDVVRVKLWRPDGTIIYSDDRRLIGERFVLGADERRVLRTGGTDAEVSDLARPENRFEPRGRKLLEVYLPLQTASGPLLYEQYLRFSSVAATTRRLWLSLLPALLLALVLLEVLQVPLALSLARRVRRAQREREAMLVKAVDASNVERRRIARDLHDGPVQELAGTAFSIGAAAERVGAGGSTEAAAVLREAAESLRGAVRRLRSLLVAIHPPTLERAGLRAALNDLVAPATAQGLEVDLDVDDAFAASPDVQALLYRTAQEAVRNTLAHADARSLRVTVRRANGRASLDVSDDGRGFSEPERTRAIEGGHLGLALLEDLARDAGGRLDVDSSPEGTHVRLEVPT
jgi:two-component system NarL family sensor kinase